MAGTANDVTYGLDQYNPASQVTQRSTSNDSYVWTNAVNVNRSYTVNGLNQYESAGPAVFGYDGNGNLTSDGTNGFVYDVENRLVSRAGATTASLRYDPLGRLYEVAESSGTTRFQHDGDELVAEYDGSTGTLLRRYLHGLSVDDPVLAYEGAAFSQPRLLYANHQGSIFAVSDISGAVTAKNSYDDWGIPGAANTAIAAGGRFSYTGQVWLPELGMYYYKARIYSPTLGRFMQTDPVGYKDGPHLYAYVGNDPINLRDPSGLCPNCVSGAVGGFVGGVVSGGSELIGQVWSGEEIDWKEVGKEAASGAVGGAVTGFTGNPAFGGAAQAAAGDLINGERPSVTNALAGAAGGFIGGRFADRVTRGVVGNQRFGAMVAKPDVDGILSNNGKVAMRAAENSAERLKRVGGQVAGESTANALVPGGEEIVVIGRRLGDNSLRGCFGMCDGVKD